MPTPAQDALLNLETAERNWAERQSALAAAPAEAAQLDAAERAAATRLEESRAAAQALEVKRQGLALERKNLEEKVVRLKTQQMQVKKQEEFEAFGREVAHAEAEIGRLEDAELEVLMAQDDARAALARAEAEAAAERARIAHERELLQARTETARAELAAAAAARDNARQAVPAPMLSAWDAVRKLVRRGPWLVQMEDGHRCGGCHLRVSNEVSEQVQRHRDVVHCDQCGRLLYQV